jgi:hypothetical protein
VPETPRRDTHRRRLDGQTNQLIWRGYDVNTIDMKKPDKRLDKAVDGLVKKFIKDTNARS